VRDERTWTIKTTKNDDGWVRAQCGIKGCREYREHQDRNLAARFIVGHMVAQHRKDGVDASDHFEIK
jgi:hypothetical protein